MCKICLVNGRASRLGRDIAEAAPSVGDRLVAIAHDARRCARPVLRRPW
jgi:hypothetical protein